MSRTEDLLREALASTPVDPNTDVLYGLEARIKRARRRLAVAGSVAVCVVAAAIVVPLATLSIGGSKASGVHVTTTPTPLPTPPPTPVRGSDGTATWLPSGATQVDVGDDGSGRTGVWALTRGTAPDTGVVVGFDPASGATTHRILVPGPVDFLSVGLGYVWAYGGGDGGSGSLSVIDRVNPQSGKVDTLRITGAGGPSSMAFTAQGAYVTLSAANKVVRVSDVTGPLSQQQSLAVPGQPEWLTVVDDGTAWVEEGQAHRWAHLDLSDGQMRVVETQPWSGRLFGLSHDGYVWTSDDPGRVIELSPGTLTAGVSVSYGNRVSTVGPPIDVVDQWGTGGIFVATADTSGANAGEGTAISYYSPAAVRIGNSPTAQLAGVVVASDLVATPDGGVVFVTDAGSVEHWKP